MFKRLKRYLAKKLVPYADIPRPKYEVRYFDIEEVATEVTIPFDMASVVPKSAWKKEIAQNLSRGLINYIDFHTTEDRYTGAIRYRGVIKIAKERR